jgi:hypothetical protein
MFGIISLGISLISALAVTHILQLETECKGLKQKVSSMSHEIDRLRQLNEQMMLSHAAQAQRTSF